jgi:methionine sulfoxide reductase heme-binding subunit
MRRALQHPAAKPALFVLALLPMATLVAGVLQHTLGANPAETLIRSLGDWTLRFLCLTLAVTPLRQWTGVNALARFRRMLGLFTAFYAAVHFSAYAVFDMGLDWNDIVRDVAKRPFILVGTAAFLLLLPLAATSFNRAIRALGAARWQRLHRTVYAIAGLAILHFFWMRAGKRNFAEVVVYATILGVLLGWRLVRAMGPRYFMKLGSHSARG